MRTKAPAGATGDPPCGSPVPASGRASNSRTGHRAKRPMTRGTRSASVHGLPTHTTPGVSRKNAHQGAGGCHGRSALRLARAGVRTGLEQPHGSSGETPDDPWHPERSVHGLPAHTTRGASRKNVHQGAGGCHGRSALRIARAVVRTGVEQPHGSSGEAPDDPWHPERSVHGLPAHTTRGASWKNAPGATTVPLGAQSCPARDAVSAEGSSVGRRTHDCSPSRTVVARRVPRAIRLADRPCRRQDGPRTAARVIGRSAR